MMVLYRSPEYKAVQVNNEDKYRLLKFNFSISRTDNTDWSVMTWPIIKLIWDLMLIYIVTKFGVDWFIFVDARK